MKLPNRGGLLRWASVKPVPTEKVVPFGRATSKRAEPAVVPTGARLMLDRLGRGVTKPFAPERRRRSSRLVPRARLPQHFPLTAHRASMSVRRITQVADATATHLGQHSGMPAAEAWKNSRVGARSALERGSNGRCVEHPEFKFRHKSLQKIRSSHHLH